MDADASGLNSGGPRSRGGSVTGAVSLSARYMTLWNVQASLGESSSDASLT